jgi:hypothetical protein
MHGQFYMRDLNKEPIIVILENIYLYCNFDIVIELYKLPPKANQPHNSEVISFYYYFSVLLIGILEFN